MHKRCNVKDQKMFGYVQAFILIFINVFLFKCLNKALYLLYSRFINDFVR